MEDAEKNNRKPRRPYPRFTLEQSLVLAKAIQDKNAGKPLNRILLAQAIDKSPSGIDFRDLLSSSYKYGLTEGTEKAEYVSLTELGKSIVQPLDDSEERRAKKQSIMIPEVFKRIYEHFNNGKIPENSFFENILTRQFSIPHEYKEELADIIMKNASFVGILSNNYIILNLETSQQEVKDIDLNSGGDAATEDREQDEKIETREWVSANPIDEQFKPIFIAHGKNKKPLEQLKKILDEFKIPYKVAIDEPNGGRPISTKLRELMQECGSAIFIFSSDGEPQDPKLGSIANLNVVFELGAASVLYGDKLILFKEDELNLASDFEDLGYIGFEKDKLEAKTMDLIKELLNMHMLKIIPA